jgi:hypothetical protein
LHELDALNGTIAKSPASVTSIRMVLTKQEGCKDFVIRDAVLGEPAAMVLIRKRGASPPAKKSPLERPSPFRPP